MSNLKLMYFLELLKETTFSNLLYYLSLYMHYKINCCFHIGPHKFLTSQLMGFFSIFNSNYLATFIFSCFKNYDVSLDMVFVTSLIISIIYILSCSGLLSDILPSHAALRGAFCRKGIVVNNKSKIASPCMKKAIQDIGKIYGCHHCGQYVKKYICDHIPPSCLNNNGLQNLYPQCQDCSNFQGGLLSIKPDISKKGLIFYSWKPKLCLIWLPYFMLFELVINS